jgi:aldose sugar dehydrogenase
MTSLSLPRLILWVATLILSLSVAGCAQPAGKNNPQPTLPLMESIPGSGEPGQHIGQVVTLVAGLHTPWALEFLPDSRLLVSEKGGKLTMFNTDTWQQQAINGVPAVANAGQGGLMDVAVHPDFSNQPWIYFSYAVANGGAYSTRVSRAQLIGTELRKLEVLFSASPFFSERRHFGSRLLIDGDYLFITVGDRGNRSRPQKLDNHAGKILRLKLDGSIPGDNPFVGVEQARPEIWSYGHRNPQGLVKHPGTDTLWSTEHGPQGGDEINIVRRGANYGWPVITYGEEYGGGKIGEGTHKQGMEQPQMFYTPSLGTSGVVFYDGDRYPGWQPSLLIGGLRQTRISRIELQGDQLGAETSLMLNARMRIRDLQLGPDGLIYGLAGGSRLIRLEPIEL